MLREFALSTKEGLALMVLAEALLRVPDARTADQFIEDKLGQGDFVHHETKSSAFLVNASAWALGMSARVIQPGETPQGTIGRLTKRLGAPAVRAATRQAMRLMGNHFVLGETIEAALERAEPHSAQRRAIPSTCSAKARAPQKTPRAISIPMHSAIEAIGRAADNRPLPDRPGISVKLSALHPRFEAVSHQRVMTRTGSAADRSGAASKGLRPEFHRRCRGSRPAGIVTRRDRSRVRRSPRLPAGTVLAWPSRPIRSAPVR